MDRELVNEVKTPEISISQAWPIFAVLSNNNLWTQIIKKMTRGGSASTEFSPDFMLRDKILAVLGDVRFLIRSAQKGVFHLLELPPSSPKFILKNVHRIFHNADALMNSGRIDEIATAMANGETIYASQELIHLAAVNKQPRFIHWVQKNGLTAYPVVIIPPLYTKFINVVE